MRGDRIIWAMTDIADDLIREAMEVPEMKKHRMKKPAMLGLIAAIVAVLLAGTALAAVHYTKNTARK